MRANIFVDTSYAIALSSDRDQFHEQAAQLADELERSEVQLITTRAILLEIGNLLSKQRYREAAVALLVALEADPKVEIVPLTEELYMRALELFRERKDKEWGLVGCISFVIMRDRNIYEALSTDEHFLQAGFRPLLLV